MVEDPLQLLRIKCVADEQGDGVLGELLFSQMMTSLIGYSDYTSTRHSMCKFIKDASVSHQMYNVS